jgi:phosphoribosylanthranilate isomerase
MEPGGRPRVKVCCIASVAEAWLAIGHGASALGLVAAMPSGPGVIAEEQIAAIARRIPPGVTSVLLTSAREVDRIIEQRRRLRVNALQLVDELAAGEHAALRRTLPGVGLLQAIHVTGPASVDGALAVAPHVDALLLDSGNPALAVKELGGTVRVHNWALSREIRDRSPVPVYLAGGLNAGNVAAAIQEVGPFGVDVCSGVRTNGALNPAKLAGFFTAVAGRSSRRLRSEPGPLSR